MSFGPFKINDRRGSATGWAGNNTLIAAATQTTDRKRQPMLDADVHRTITDYGRRVLMTLGRHIYWNFPAMHGAILEQANLSVSTFIPQYGGRNKAWGELAEEKLYEWHKIMDVAGQPFDYDSFVRGKIVDPMVDGENFTLLTQTPDGFPLIQIIPAHRVGGSTAADLTAKVRFSGDQMIIDGIVVDDNRPYATDKEISFEAQIVDGVIPDAYGRALAYRVYQDSRTADVWQDISARNLFPTFCPEVVGQVRGFSGLASSVFALQDIKEWREFEMLAQKAAATQGIMETNETGDVDTAKSVISLPATTDSAGAKTSLDVQKLEGGTIKYFKAGTGSKLEAFNYSRPGGESQKFVAEHLRDAFKGTQWDAFFSLDPQAVGGAPMRAILFKINARIAEMQKPVNKACTRVDGYALSKFIQNGELPFDPDWYKWSYQGPGQVTADKAYDSDVDLKEISQGIGTKKNAIARRGEYYEEVREQRKTEVDDEITDAKELAAKHGITFQEAVVLLRPPNPNQQLPQAQQTSPSPGGEGRGEGEPSN